MKAIAMPNAASDRLGKVITPAPADGAVVELALAAVLDPVPDVAGTAEAEEEPDLLVAEVVAEEPSAAVPGSSGDEGEAEEVSEDPEVDDEDVEDGVSLETCDEVVGEADEVGAGVAEFLAPKPDTWLV